MNGKRLGKCERGQANAMIEFLEKIAVALDLEPNAFFDNAHEKDRGALVEQLKMQIEKANLQELKVISRVLAAILN